LKSLKSLNGFNDLNDLMDLIQRSLERLEEWIEGNLWMGFDPHDALNSPILRHLSFGNRILGILFLQSLKRCPVNVRLLLGIKKGYNPKGMGLFLSGYLKKHQLTGDKSDMAKAEFFIKWIRENSSKGYNGYCWGYNFDWPNRSFFAPAGTPTAVNTSFIGSAFVDAYEITGRKELLDVARSACDFLLEDLNIISNDKGTYFSYTPLDKRCVHNVNALVAALLAKVHSHSGEAELLGYAREAMNFTISCQHPDGSWPYGEGRTEHWIDNFHTGFVLEALADFISYSGINDFARQLQIGYCFFRDNFFYDGAPKYYHDRLYPIDIHSVAQAVLTFLKLRKLDPQALSMAHKIAAWGIGNMQDATGYFHYQIHRFYRIKIPYIRWGQAWMYKALANLIMEESNERLG